jgi:hypothetical protein
MNMKNAIPRLSSVRYVQGQSLLFDATGGGVTRERRVELQGRRSGDGGHGEFRKTVMRKVISNLDSN